MNDWIVLPSTVTFNTLMGCVAWQRALALLKTMSSFQASPNAPGINVFVAGWSLDPNLLGFWWFLWCFLIELIYSLYQHLFLESKLICYHNIYSSPCFCSRGPTTISRWCHTIPPCLCACVMTPGKWHWNSFGMRWFEIRSVTALLWWLVEIDGKDEVEVRWVWCF